MDIAANMHINVSFSVIVVDVNFIITRRPRLHFNGKKSSQRPHTSAKEIMVWIRSPSPDTDSGSGLLLKFNGNFFVQGYICGKIFVKIRSLSPEKPNCGKILYLAALKNPSKNS